MKMITVYQMDVMRALRQMPDAYVDMVITSPPYWSLRDYGIPPTFWGGDSTCRHRRGSRDAKMEKTHLRHNSAALRSKKQASQPQQSNFCVKCGAWKGQLGLEPSYGLFVSHLCDIFDEVKRVLKPDGTCWVNLGDTYVGNRNGTNDYRAKFSKSISGKRFDYNTMYQGKQKKAYQTLPSKCLCQIPSRFAIEMTDRSWILRNEIIWHKPNCIPSSAKDRFTVDFEYLFLFAKQKSYYFEQQHEPLAYPSEKARWICERIYREVKRSKSQGKLYKGSKSHGQSIQAKSCQSFILSMLETGQRILKTVTLKKPEEQFVNNWLKNHTGYPQGRNKRCVWTIPTRPYKEAHFAVFPEELVKTPIMTTRPNAVVLDIFAGSGTTLKVVRETGRRAIGIERNSKYVNLIRKRVFGTQKPSPEEFNVIR